MKKPIGEYERKLKSNKGKELKVNQSHDAEAFAAWHEVRELHREVRQFVYEYRDSATETGVMEVGLLVEKLQQIFTLMQSVKERYGPQNNLQINVELAAVEVKHPEKGWVTINSQPTQVDLALPHLDRMVAIASLEPDHYAALRLKFGEGNRIRMKQPALAQFNSDGESEGDWISYPLVFDADDTRQRTISYDLTMVESKSLDFILSLDQKNSFSVSQEGKFVFNPVFNIKNVTGDEYVDPAERL